MNTNRLYILLGIAFYFLQLTLSVILVAAGEIAGGFTNIPHPWGWIVTYSSGAYSYGFIHGIFVFEGCLAVIAIVLYVSYGVWLLRRGRG